MNRMNLRERLRDALCQPHWLERYQNVPTGRILASPDDLITDIIHTVVTDLITRNLNSVAMEIGQEDIAAKTQKGHRP